MTGLRKAVEFVLEGLPFISMAMLLAVSQSVWWNPPQQCHWEMIQYALEEGKGKVGNDFGFGYWVFWLGGDTNSYSTFHRQPPKWESQVVVTEQELGSNCKKLKQCGEVKVYLC